MTKKSIEIPSEYEGDRKVTLKYIDGVDGSLGIRDLRQPNQPLVNAFVMKEDLLDALAQIGWLPEEYRKPEPVDPREAKIREVATTLFNSDNGTALTVEEYGARLARYDNTWEGSGYYENAEALIDAGLVQLDD